MNASFKAMTDDNFSNQRRLPERGRCETMYLEQFPDLSKCLVEDSDVCEFAVRFRSGVYCYHPDRFSFEKTGPLDHSSSR